MFMKKYIILSLLCIGLGGCNSWLDVTSDQEVYEESMFEESRGYYTALNGLYILMSEGTLYGANLSYGAMEAWSRSYDLDNNNLTTFLDLANLKYENSGPKSLGEAIWLRCYKIIAEANNLIQALEADKNVVFKHGDATRNMVLGEAYAIRSLMHFEVVRVFTKAPVIDGGGVTATVPYVTEYPSRVNPPVPTKEILASVIKELEKARELVKPFDTESEYPGSLSYLDRNVDRRLKLEVTGDITVTHASEEFFRYRADRLGYYPMTLLLARVCLYAGDKDKAYEYASEIVEMVNTQTIYDFTAPGFIGNPEIAISSVHPRLHEEIIWGLYNSKLTDLTESYFGESVTTNKLRIKDPNDLFDNANDVRLKAIVDRMPTKFSITGSNESDMKRASTTIPVMRIPEAYFIAAECVFEKDKEKALELFHTVLKKRLNEVYSLPTDVDRVRFMDALVEEYRREFLCEGQLIFLYKRLNIPIRITGGEFAHDGKLVIPVPDTEAGIE